uniref:Uncharacterized protein n=1 Tax=Opuntia streptacantha TaxID=393608 RepID=A0A7C9E8G5_OPUST
MPRLFRRLLLLLHFNRISLNLFRRPTVGHRVQRTRSRQCVDGEVSGVALPKPGKEDLEVMAGVVFGFSKLLGAEPSMKAKRESGKRNSVDGERRESCEVKGCKRSRSSSYCCHCRH